MKHFSLVLKNKANGKETDYLNTPALRHFSRKELIAIITKRFDGSIPKEHNLIEMENEELIGLVGDQMFIIAYMTDKWSKEPIKTTLPSSSEKKVVPLAKNKTNGKGKKD